MGTDCSITYQVKVAGQWQNVENDFFRDYETVRILCGVDLLSHNRNDVIDPITVLNPQSRRSHHNVTLKQFRSYNWDRSFVQRALTSIASYNEWVGTDWRTPRTYWAWSSMPNIGMDDYDRGNFPKGFDQTIEFDIDVNWEMPLKELKAYAIYQNLEEWVASSKASDGRITMSLH